MRLFHYLLIFGLINSHCANWSQARASWWQMWVELISAIVAILSFWWHFEKNKVRWYSTYKVKHKHKRLNIRIHNLSKENAKDTLIFHQPYFVICNNHCLKYFKQYHSNLNKIFSKNSCYYHIIIPNNTHNDNLLHKDNISSKKYNLPSYFGYIPKISRKTKNDIFEIHGTSKIKHKLSLPINGIQQTFSWGRIKYLYYGKDPHKHPYMRTRPIPNNSLLLIVIPIFDSNKGLHGKYTSLILNFNNFYKL